jgi:membrane-associated phospholipid phosphatase
VAAGSLTGADQWACDHLMPGAGRPGPPPTFLESLVPLLHADLGTPLRATSQIVTLPGQLVVSLLAVVVAAVALLRQGRGSAAVAWLAAWSVASAIEVACKHALTRPALTRDGLHATAFDSSWPSGHAVRSVVAAAALASAWPRARAWLGVWLAGALVLLVAAGFHTPSDVLGGVLLAVPLLVAATAVERSGLLDRAALALRGRARASPRGRG